jgi:hypothetical protein
MATITEDDTFKVLRRVSVTEMGAILRKHFLSMPFTFTEFHRLLKEHHWTQTEYDNEYRELVKKDIRQQQ